MKKTRAPVALLNFLKTIVIKIILKKLKRSLIISCLFINTGLMAQYEWAPIGAEWYYCIPERSSNDPRYSYEKYIATVDTLIQGKTCRIVKSDFNTEYFYQDGYKVYYWYKDTFNLIYDFGASLNDTIIFGFKSGSQVSIMTGEVIIDTVIDVECIVYNIDTLHIDNSSLREIRLKVIKKEELDYLVWPSYYHYIDKIGFTYEYLIIIRPATLDYTYKLRCYNDIDISYTYYWWEYLGYSCDYTLGISDSEYQLAEIYPNPVKSELVINIPGQYNVNDINIEIADISGKKVQYLQACANTEQYYLPNLTSGIYFIKIYYKQEIKQITKIVKL